MGKSGHVARKIAATLASTGTPALYVHPAEASHGDLGMITPQDAVLALSNSGETTELRDMILYTRRFAIPLLALVGRAPSTLAEAADLVPAAARGRRGLPDGPGAHHLDHLHAGAGRRPGGGAARAARLLGARLRRVPSGRQARQPAPARRAADAPRRRPAAGRAGHQPRRRGPRDEQEAAGLRRRRRETGGWSGSSPTATCAGTWRPTSSPAPRARS